MSKLSTLAAILLVGSTALVISTPSLALDERAAKAFFKENDCTKCHAPAKTKKGPSLKKIAQENKDKANYEEEMIKHMTSSPMVTLEDGTEDEHKMVDTKDPAVLKNLVQYIMSHQ